MPLNYNDGSLVEESKFLITKDEIVDRFKAISALTPTPGTWMDETDGTSHEDIMAGFFVDVDGLDEATLDWITKYKATLAERFKQKVIYISSQEVNIL